MNVHDDFKEDIDWSVLKSQQNPKSQKQEAMPQDENPYHQDMPLTGKRDVAKVDTFLGQMPRRSPEFQSGTPENSKQIQEMISSMVGAPGMNVMGKMAAPIVKRGISATSEFMHPERGAERLRSSLGEGTSRENIDNLSQRAQFAKNSTQQEALIPKEEIYKQEGKSDVYNVDKSKLPEGNVPKMAEMMAPGERFNESQEKALSKAIADYRKTGNIESFADKSEEIFNIPELNNKAFNKVEEALLMPTKRGSKYFTEEGVTDYYGKRGLKTLHNEYENKPILSNYDKLQSAIKKEMRKLSGKGKSLDSAGDEKLSALEQNVKNLDADKEAFMKTLPDKMQNLENEFRQKYANYAEKYEKGAKETGASLTLRRLAEGRGHLVDDAAVVKLFSKPTAADKKVLLDMGEGAARNAIYAALQKVPMNDAEGIAKTVLDLKRTKGFDEIITVDMEKNANNILKQVRQSNFLKDALKTGAGAAAGALSIGGLAGAGIGGALANSPKIAKYIAERFKK